MQNKQINKAPPLAQGGRWVVSFWWDVGNCTRAVSTATETLTVTHEPPAPCSRTISMSNCRCACASVWKMALPSFSPPYFAINISNTIIIIIIRYICCQPRSGFKPFSQDRPVSLLPAGAPSQVNCWFHVATRLSRIPPKKTQRHTTHFHVRTLPSATHLLSVHVGI